jgi:hypothetical protein
VRVVVTEVEAAIALIAATPGYDDVARDLRRLLERGKIRFVPALEDRAHAGLTGTITLGPEALEASALGLAETLVHEHFHLRRQSHLAKTVSFWRGVLTGAPVMRAYERPAYAAALDFLRAVERAFPEQAADARREQTEVAAAFAAVYGPETGPSPPTTV